MRRAAAIALLLFVACAKQEEPIGTTSADAAAPARVPPPSAAEARTIIETAPELGEFQFTEAAYSLPVSGVAMNEPQRKAADDLMRAGWIARENTGDVMLNDKSRNDKRFLMRPNGLVDIVPLAKKQMGDVTAIRANEDGTVDVDFTWRWIANEIGAAFQGERYAGTQNATANLMHDGSRWAVISIKAR